jgi:hypothetical protein
LVPADYDGDSKDDYAVLRSGTWYILKSSGGTATVAFGAAGDVASPGDYDGDHKYDVGVFRPSNGTWYVVKSSDNTSFAQPFGASGDVSVPARYIP